MSRIEVIRTLLTDNENVLEFMFPNHEEVEDYGGFHVNLERVEKMGHLSSGEQIMLRLALDIWGGYGQVKIEDLCRRLDGDNFKRAMIALIEFRKI